MHIMRIVSLIDMRIRLVRHGLSKELAQWLPSVAKMMLQQPLLWHHFSHVRIMIDEALSQRCSILPVPGAIVAQHEDERVGVSEESLQGGGAVFMFALVTVRRKREQISKVSRGGGGKKGAIE